MKTLMYSAATALVLVSSHALAQDKTLDPNGITIDAKRPPLQLNDQQRTAIQDGLETENTQQKTPPNFEPKVGEALPATMTVDAMPELLIRREPSLKQYGYAKLSKNVLVLDPMKKIDRCRRPAQNADGRQSRDARRLGENAWPRVDRPGAGDDGHRTAA